MWNGMGRKVIPDEWLAVARAIATGLSSETAKSLLDEQGNFKMLEDPAICTLLAEVQEATLLQGIANCKNTRDNFSTTILEKKTVYFSRNNGRAICVGMIAVLPLCMDIVACCAIVQCRRDTWCVLDVGAEVDYSSFQEAQVRFLQRFSRSAQQI